MPRTKQSKQSVIVTSTTTASALAPSGQVTATHAATPAPTASASATLPVTKIPAVIVAPTSNANATPLPSAATSTPTAASSYALAAKAGADSPPKVTLPSVPTDFTEPMMRTFRGLYPNKIELAEMPDAEAELRGFPDYASIMGSATTPAEDFANALELGRAWRKLRDESAAWDTYVKAQDAKAWKTAMAMLDDVRPIFQRAAQKNTALVLVYPALTALFDGTKMMAKASASARAAKAKSDAAAAATAAKAASDAATATAVAAANAAGIATGRAESAAAAVTPKAVTVNA
jgi:hypothetical protein